MVGSVHRLVRWQRRLLYGAGAALLASGVGWLAVHYGRSADALPSPLEAWAMRIHGLASFLVLFGFGALAASHRRSHELRVPILWIAQAVMAGGVLWFFVVRGGAGFFVAQLLVSAAFYAVTPFLTSRLSGLDADGSLLSRSIVITFVAAFAGTALAGTALTQLGGPGCGLALGACALSAMPFTWRAFGREAEPAC